MTQPGLKDGTITVTATDITGYCINVDMTMYLDIPRIFYIMIQIAKQTGNIIESIFLYEGTMNPKGNNIDIVYMIDNTLNPTVLSHFLESEEDLAGSRRAEYDAIIADKRDDWIKEFSEYLDEEWYKENEVVTNEVTDKDTEKDLKNIKVQSSRSEILLILLIKNIHLYMYKFPILFVEKDYTHLYKLIEILIDRNILSKKKLRAAIRKFKKDYKFPFNKDFRYLLIHEEMTFNIFNLLLRLDMILINHNRMIKDKYLKIRKYYTQVKKITICKYNEAQEQTEITKLQKTENISQTDLDWVLDHSLELLVKEQIPRTTLH